MTLLGSTVALCWPSADDTCQPFVSSPDQDAPPTLKLTCIMPWVAGWMLGRSTSKVLARASLMRSTVSTDTTDWDDVNRTSQIATSSGALASRVLSAGGSPPRGPSVTVRSCGVSGIGSHHDMHFRCTHRHPEDIGGFNSAPPAPATAAP